MRHLYNVTCTEFQLTIQMQCNTPRVKLHLYDDSAVLVFSLKTPTEEINVGLDRHKQLLIYVDFTCKVTQYDIHIWSNLW